MKSDKGQPLLPFAKQMEAWSSSLAAEIAEWPRASARSFFGFTALYRGEHIFAMLPRTKSFGNGNLLAFRIDDPPARLRARFESDSRVSLVDQGNNRWLTFELSCDTDLHAALEWLGTAYRYASKRKNSKQ